MRVLLLQCVLSSDEAVFGGYENASKKYDVSYQTQVWADYILLDCHLSCTFQTYHPSWPHI